MNSQQINTPPNALIEHSDKLLKLARSIYDSCCRKRNKVKSHYRFILSAYFSRAYELFESIILLIRNDRVTDAGVLLRSLSNLLINLGYVDKARKERATLLLFDFATQHLKLYKKSKKYFDSIGKSAQVDSYIQHYEKEKNKLDKILKTKYPNSKPWDEIRISERAQASQNLQYIYNLLYADLSRFEHHDFSAVITYVNPDTCDPILKTGAHRHSSVLNQRSILSLSSILFGIVLELFNGEYQLKWKDEIDEMARKLATMEQLTPAS